MPHATLRLPPPDLAALPPERLEAMHDAAALLLETRAAFARSGTSVLGEVLRDQGAFTIWQNYPRGDVFDTESHCHYFYHAHTPEEMDPGENGHFHIFLRPEEIDPSLAPWDVPGAAPLPAPGARFAHLCAIGMDAQGAPTRLFVTNAWVTGETLYRATDLVPLIERFRIGVVHPNWAISEWLTAVVALFAPQIEALLGARDAALIAGLGPEDRSAQNLAEAALDISAQIVALENALGL
ncbi:MAG: hypothetical protein AB7U46_05985 [Paenirhodobacter sp.]|uniref:DUF6969 family protein n=1 Tax=Paenirhodobacter sp. TaxID=1965326 RepID=UPI003D137E85